MKDDDVFLKHVLDSINQIEEYVDDMDSKILSATGLFRMELSGNLRLLARQQNISHLS